jgi:hypothetical protein
VFRIRDQKGNARAVIVGAVLTPAIAAELSP